MYYDTGAWKMKRKSKMIKKWIASLIIGIIVITGSCLGYLQYGRDMDVCGSHITSFDNYEEERLSIVINKLYVANQKACAEEIVSKEIIYL